MYKRSMSGLYTLTEWISKFVYINFLWMGFSLVGLVVLGFAPSTVALFTVVRKWIMGNHDIPIFKTYRETFKKEFLRSNGVGAILLGFSALMLANLYFMDLNATSSFNLAHLPLYLVMFAIVMTVLYIFPVYVHFHVPFFHLFKNAFLIMLINPISNIVMLLGLAGTFIVIQALPGVGFFFGASISAGIIMASCYIAFQRLDKKSGKAPIA